MSIYVKPIKRKTLNPTLIILTLQLHTNIEILGLSDEKLYIYIYIYISAKYLSFSFSYYSSIKL